MKKDYNQYYTSSLFNIKNKIDYSLKTICINLFTNKDIEIFNKIKNKIVIYNNSLNFFKYLNIVKKVIQSGISIYSDNIKIRRYLYENGAKPKFIEKKYIQVDKNIDLSLFNMFNISSDEKYPLVIKMHGNNNIIIKRLQKKLQTIVVDKINIWDIENVVYSKQLLYIEDVDAFIKGITDNLYVSDELEHFSKILREKYCKNDYCVDGVCIFFGLYNENDITALKKHNGIKFLIWRDNDLNLNYIDEINKIINIYHFSSSKKKEILDSRKIENIYFDIKHDYMFDYSNVLIIINNGSTYHGEICNIKLLTSINIDYVFFNNIDKINYQKYEYILIDGLLLNEIISGIDNTSFINIINHYFKNKTIILLFHDLHFWSHNGYLIRNINYLIPENLLKINNYFFNNIQFYKNMNVKYYISLYNCLEFHNIVNNSNFIKSSYINYYPTFENFNYIETYKTYNILIYGSITNYIYPLRNKLYNFLIKNEINNTKIIENISNINNSIHGMELNKLINSSWLSVATTSLFNYYLKKYNEIGNTSSVIIGNITSEIKNVIGDNYIYVNNNCSYNYFIELIKYYLDNKPTICYINYYCNQNLEKNNFTTYEQRMKEIIKNIKYNEYTELEYNYYNKTCNLIDVNNYFYIQKNVRQEDNTILMTNNIYNELKLITKENNNYYYYYKKTENTKNNYIGNFYKIIKYKIIDQIYSNTSFENIEKYHSKNKPSFFYGIFNNTAIINSHNNIKILILTENDTKYIDNNELIKYNNNKNTYIISVSNLISIFLDKLYIKYIYEPNFLNKSNNIFVYTEIYYKFNINYYFDRIYVLNLKKDVNKREKIKTMFNKYNINNYEFFEGIYGKEDNELLNEYDIYSKIPFDSREKLLKRKLIGSVNVLANLLSVRNIIIDAKNKNYKKILFLEDDIYLHNDFNNLFINIVSKLDNWKILYLGIQNNLNNKIIMNNLYDANINSSGGWSFGIDCSVYDELINECNKKNLPFDSGPLYYIRSHYPTQCKVIYPNLIICDISTSSIRNYKRNLKKSYENFKWNIDEYNMNNILYIWTGDMSNDKWFKNIKIVESFMNYNNNFDFLEYKKINNKTIFDKYNIIIIQYWCISYINNNDINNILKKLFKNKSVYLIIYDIHPYSFDIKLYNKTITNNLTNNDIKIAYTNFNSLLEEYNIKHIIGSYECKESEYILKYCNIKYEIIHHHIDSNIFNISKNFNYDDKIYDILIFGNICNTQTSYLTYPLRNKIYNLLNNMKDMKLFRIKIVESIDFIELPSYIEKSWLTVSTCGYSNYFVQKYIEIIACKSVILGNIPKQAEKIFDKDSYIHIDINITDEEFECVILNNLKNKNKLINICEKMYNIVHKNYGLEKYDEKINNILQIN